MPARPAQGGPRRVRLFRCERLALEKLAIPELFGEVRDRVIQPFLKAPRVVLIAGRVLARLFIHRLGGVEHGLQHRVNALGAGRPDRVAGNPRG